ncbi:MAG: hypothetical protein H6577_19800 [Lewinellaceae bacterium]|nr:hypothetical protein [Lewinellaceae bacterium]
MKHQLQFTFLLFLFVQVLKAQDENPPRYIIGGGLRIFVSNNISSDDTQINIAPNKGEYVETGFAIAPYAGKYLTQRQIFGLVVGYELTINKPNSLSNEKYTANAISTGVFYRYLLNPGNKLVVQIEPSILFQYQTAGYKSDNLPNNNLNLNALVGRIEISPLISYALSDKLNLVGRFGALQFLTGYWDYGGGNDKQTFSHFSTNLNLSYLQLRLEVKL